MLEALLLFELALEIRRRSFSGSAIMYCKRINAIF